MNRRVSDYLKHFINSFERSHRLSSFFTDNVDLLLPTEVVVRDNLAAAATAEGDDHEEMLLRYEAMKEVVPAAAASGFVKRFCVNEATEFPHLGAPERCIYSTRRYTPFLERPVVYVNNGGWLLFRQRMTGIPPGTYEVSVRFRMDDRLTWGHSFPWRGMPSEEAHISVYRVVLDKRISLVSQNFLPQMWKEIRDGRLNQNILKNAKVVPDDCMAHWFTLVMKKFRLTEEEEEEEEQESAVDFEWRDVDNPSWKRGMAWDFIQIQKVS
jgi:hypothetical protein